MRAAKEQRTDDRRARKKLRRRGLLAKLRDVAGNATTETVIMMPVFIAIWASIWYTHQRYRAGVQMSQYTRAHVWAHAFSGCEDSPPGDTRISEDVESADGFISGAVSLIFGSGILPGFQFDEIEGQRDTSIERPAVLGEGTVTMEHDLVVMCNEKTQADTNMADAAIDLFF